MQLLLLDPRPDQDQEDEYVLNHLNVELGAPVHVKEPDKVHQDHGGVRGNVHPKEPFLQISIDFRI